VSVTPGAAAKPMTVSGAAIAYFEVRTDINYDLALDDLAITYPDAPQPADVSVTGVPSVVEVLDGTSNPVGVDLTRLNGSNGDVTFSVSGLPAGMTASFAPNPVGGTGTHTVMTLTAPRDAATSDYANATITATPTGGASVAPGPRTLSFTTR